MRIYNKWHKELWFWIQENLFEIVCFGLMLIIVVSILVAFKYGV